MGQYKHILMKKNKVCMWKQGKEEDLFSLSYQQVMSSHFVKGKTSVHIVVAPKDKLNNKCARPSFLLAFVA